MIKRSFIEFIVNVPREEGADVLLAMSVTDPRVRASLYRGYVLVTDDISLPVYIALAGAYHLQEEPDSSEKQESQRRFGAAMLSKKSDLEDKAILTGSRILRSYGILGSTVQGEYYKLELQNIEGLRIEYQDLSDFLRDESVARGERQGDLTDKAKGAGLQLIKR